eukprot:192478-Rhodomonas_salina.2
MFWSLNAHSVPEWHRMSGGSRYVSTTATMSVPSMSQAYQGRHRVGAQGDTWRHSILHWVCSDRIELITNQATTSRSIPSQPGTPGAM